MEPSLSWGLRMAIAGVVPVIWGVATGHRQEAEWIALTADCICWVSLKGTYGQRLRILAGGTLLAFLFGTLGSITGHSLALSIICMLGVGFMAGLFRNLGERGSGLALSVYVIFLIANAAPVSGEALYERMALILIGGAWNAALAIISIFFLPEQQPYRRNISIIWRAAALLMERVSKGWDGKSIRSSQRDIYQAEKDVRTAIDTSFAFHEQAVHQLQTKGINNAEYQLAQGRKLSALVTVNMAAIAEELEQVRLKSVDDALRVRLFSLMRSIQRAAERMSALILTRRAEEEVLMSDALEGIRKQLIALEEYKAPEPLYLSRIVRRVMQLSRRSLRMMERSMELITSVSEARVFRAYPVLKTIYLLHPRHWMQSIRLFFSIGSLTARYAARTAIASTLALALYKILKIDHGYWLPFTVIIILQPYFTATFKKAIDRLIGTVAGGVVGGLLLLLPAGLYAKEIMLFVSAIGMVHYIRTQYKVSAFFITLNLVLLFSVSQELDKQIILVRAGVTLIGAVIAIASGFLLLPNWDRKWLPRFLVESVERNWNYFTHTFSAEAAQKDNWTRCKRQAEVSNSNAFDSFNRAMQEPRGLRKDFAIYYQFITHNVRITRELNNIHLEEEAKDEKAQIHTDEETMRLIANSAELFKAILAGVATLTNKPLKTSPEYIVPHKLLPLNAIQKMYLSRLHTELSMLLQNVHSLTGHASQKAIPGNRIQPVPSKL